MEYRRIVKDINGDETVELVAPEGHWLRWYSTNGNPQCLCAACAKTVMVADSAKIEALPVTVTGGEAPDEVAVCCQACYAPLHAA